MPIIWRYLLSQYVKVLCLCTIAFIAVLLTTRLDEIAHFATLGSEGYYVLWFTLNQIPYVLPIALPISCLISAILLIQRLSRSHELTAFRASGMALNQILTPILVAAACLSLLNFYIVSEAATNSHLATGSIKNELRSINPLLLLHNKHLVRLKGLYFDILGPSKLGETASDVVLAMPNKSNNRINLMIAKKLTASPVAITGKNITLISSLGDDEREQFDSMMLENIEKVTTSIQDFSQLMQKKVWALNNDHLKLSLLLVRLNEESKLLAKAREEKKPESELKQIQRSLNRGYSEIIRRVSLAVAIFTFTLMGAAFGVSISRYHSSRGVFFVIGLAALYMIAFFAAKGVDHLFIASSLLYLVPHLVIILLSLWVLNRAAKGVE